MINVGMDFGSTYSTVSVYREDMQILEALCLEHGSPYIPTVVAENKGKYECGKAAKILTGKKNAKIFKAFKMLLPEKNPERLKERGYTEEQNPVYIAEIFIRETLQKVLEHMHEDRIGTLILGVPEIWNEGIETLDGRRVLRNICNTFDFVENTKVVSEPIGASAFFAHNYKLSTGNNYRGNILMVDYGGGTLDITLTAVEPGESDNVQIKVLERTGAGENNEGRVGKAGIVYMETVIEEAIRRCEDFEGEEIVYDGKFFKAVDELENELCNLTGTIEDVFDEFGIDDLEDLEEEEFTTIEYRGSDLYISYALLVEVYNNVIRQVLDDKLNDIISFMDDRNISYSDSNLEDFKIAIVGGFGNFYLVRKQIREKFRFSSYDKRTENIILNKSDCEIAISLGTALIAADKIGIKNTAPYSIGVWAYDVNKEICMNYAIRYKQDVEPNKVYYARGSVDNEIFRFQALGGSIDKFLVNLGHDDRTACFALAKKQFAKKLANVVTNKYRMAVIGFSVDQSGIMSLHVFDYDIMKDEIGPEAKKIELTSFSELFEITAM